jgi:hypothetical protein
MVQLQDLSVGRVSAMIAAAIFFGKTEWTDIKSAQHGAH